MRRSERIHIGTSGWEYPHWRGPFFPRDLPQAARLPFYAERFGTVEINRTFYSLPERSVFKRWREAVPEDFLFAVKGSRFITHAKKLKDPRDPLKHLFAPASALGDKLGPILFQLPPRFRANLERLDSFLAALPAGTRAAFEFRDSDWFREEVYAVLRKHGAAFCIYDIEGRLSPVVVTSDLVYLRLHGPGAKYEGSYSDDALSKWAGEIRRWRRRRLEVFVYFDNDQAGHAPANALRLKGILRA